MSFAESIKDYLSLSPLNIAGTAKALSRPPSPGGAGGMGWGYWFNSGSKINFAEEVGPIQNLALVQAGINWIARGLNSARFQAVKLDSDSKETDQPDHPVAQLFHRPNPYYSGSALMKGIAANWLTGATAYLLIMKSRFGQPAELWSEPWMTIRPRWPQNGSEIISYYEIYRNGIWTRIGQGSVYPNIEVMVVPDGWNPVTRRGDSPMTALLTEFYTDRKAALFMAQLMRSGLVPPVVVSLGSKDIPFADPDGSKQKEFRADLGRKMSGDDAGTPMVINGPTDVNKLGFDYSSVGLGEIRQIPVTRFCAAIGISPISLHLDAGDSTHANYNNVQGYLKNDYQSYIVPLQDQIADEADRVLLPMVGETENIRCAWDYTKCPLLQTDKVAETKRSTLLYISGGIDRAEFREANGYKMRTDDKDFYYEGSKPPQAPRAPGFPKPDDLSAKGFFDWTDDQDLDDGREWWAHTAPKEARALANAKPIKSNGQAVS